MRKLWTDFETRSTVDLPDSGTDRYAKDPSTEVLMLGWAFDDDEPKLWLPILGEPIPAELLEGLTDPDTMLMAWNYNFEKAIFLYKLAIDIAQKRWFDPSVLCAYLALPAGLGRAANACNIDIELKKDKKGKGGVAMFSAPSKRKKSELKKNPELSPTYYKDWTTNPDEWQDFCDYCLQDVRAERAVWYAACDFKCPIPESEIQAWLLDQRMNETGVYIDLDYVNNAKSYAESEATEIVSEMQALTGLNYTKSKQNLSKLPEWLQSRGYNFKSLDKAHVAEALKEQVRFKLPKEVVTILELKQKLGGSAYKKLASILDRVSSDNRLRAQFKYHGAHTGRWSGRGVQLQNLFKAIKAVSAVIEQVTKGIRTKTLDIPQIVAEYNAVIDAWNAENTTQKPKDKLKEFTMMQAVAGSIRSSFTATPGNKLSVGDLAQIESRVLAGLARCQHMIDTYASGLDLYRDIMVFLLNDEIEQYNSKNPGSPKKLRTYDDITTLERANGKVIILGCGFGMGWEKFIEYAATFGVTLDEASAKRYVAAFREKYSEIPSFWKELNAAVVKAVKLNICVYVRGLVIDGRNPKMLKIKLPSGRNLHYLNPTATQETTDWGAVREGVSYESWDEKGLQLKRLYGGLIAENIVQAVARDLLLNGMLEAELMGFLIIMTIHDEVVGESPLSSNLTHKDLLKALTITPEWAEGLGFILAAEGYDCAFYKK
jgi:DNA polymerase bacteriophage-type